MPTCLIAGGSHQFARPKRCMTDGTSTVHRMKASRKTAAASPMPNSAITRWPPKTKLASEKEGSSPCGVEYAGMLRSRTVWHCHGRRLAAVDTVLRDIS